MMLQNQCDHKRSIIWPLANPYINDQFKNLQCLFTQNPDFRLNTMLYGVLQLLIGIDFVLFCVCDQIAKQLESMTYSRLISVTYCICKKRQRSRTTKNIKIAYITNLSLI